MRLTRFGLAGLAFYALMVAAFFAAPYSNLFFLLLGVLSVLEAGGFLAAYRNVRGVRGSLGELAPVPSGVELQLPARLAAPDPARFQLDVVLSLAGGQRVSGRCDLLESAAATTLSAPGLPRGCHAIERAYVESSHPFGMTRMRRALDAPPELVVYPAPRVLLEGRSAAEVLDEVLGRVHRAGDDVQPTSLRDHREGDGLRRIHWRATARRARLVVSEWEGGGGQGLEVVLDRRCEANDLEEALATVSAMVHLARANKETLRVHSQGLSATFGEGHRPWAEVLRFLALARPLAEDGPEPPPVSAAVARLPLRSRDPAFAVPS